MSSPSNLESHPAGGVIRLPPLLQLALLVTLALVAATQVGSWINPGGGTARAPGHREQKVYVIGPKAGSVEDLQSLLNSGWRVTHVANAGALNPVTPITRYSVLLENGATKEQEFTFFTAGAGTQQQMDRGSAVMEQGWRITENTGTSGNGNGAGR